MDEDTPRKETRPSPAKLSKTPSWIMLGFVLGALFVFALPPIRKKSDAPSPPAAPPEPERIETPPAPPRLTTIEAVFAEWGHNAVWANNTTQVALWNVDERAYTEFYEVRRFDEVYYFRSIPKLTRRVIKRGKPIPESPLLFTETEEQYREWYEHGRRERPVERDWRPPQTSAAPRAPSVEIEAQKLSPPAVTPLEPGRPGAPEPKE